MATASISTHVLDTTSGRPAAGLGVELHRSGDAVARGVTDSDGRIRELARDLEPGVYRLVFETGAYREATGEAASRSGAAERPAATDAADAFFVRVALDVRLDEGHTHVPLLLSRYGVTSYRGS